MREISLLAELALALTLVACHNNPYTEPNDHVAPQRPQPKPTPSGPPVLKIDSPTFVEMTEGVAADVAIAPAVSAGTPIVSVQGVPAGAIYDSSRFAISWTPPQNSGVDPANPKSGYRNYQVQIEIASSLQPNVTVKQALNIRVFHPSP